MATLATIRHHRHRASDSHGRGGRGLLICYRLMRNPLVPILCLVALVVASSSSFRSISIRVEEGEDDDDDIITAITSSEGESNDGHDNMGDSRVDFAESNSNDGHGVIDNPGRGEREPSDELRAAASPAIISLADARVLSSSPSLSSSLPGEVHENGLSLRPEVITHLQSLPPFPKIVHLIWPDKAVLERDFEMLEHGAKNLRRLNPTWEFVVHDYDDIQETIRNFRHPGIVSESTRRDLLGGAHVVERTDAFRLMRVYETGGLYVDIDRVMNVNLDEVVDVANTRMVIPAYFDINFAQDLFGSSPGNDLILNVFKRQSEKRQRFPRRNGWLTSSNHMELTNTFSSSLEEDLFGRSLHGTGEAVWDEARHILSEHAEGTIVTRKDEWCSGLLVTDYDGCKSVSRDSLYDAYNVKGWAAQVNEAWEEGKME